MESVIPVLEAKTEVYDEVPFPVSNMAVAEARTHGCIAMFSGEWRFAKKQSYSDSVKIIIEKYPGSVIGFEEIDLDNGRFATYINIKLDDAWYPTSLYIKKSSVMVSLYFNDKEKARGILKALKDIWPTIEIAPDERAIDICFWVRGSQGGPRRIPRNISVMSMDDIKDNYDPKTKELLGDLSRYQPGDGGQILLFTGVPGTGKTHAIRALLWEWRKWAEYHYVVDANTFFGDAPDYLMKVIFDELDEGPLPANADKSEDTTKWKIIIMEDAGELIGSDAKQHIRHGMAQLLNLTDGMLGQGMKLIFLITTNEEIGKLDPAISRAGRCAVRHEFKSLTKEESNVWLKNHACEEQVEEAQTIAQLYAKVNGSDKRLGFNPTQPVRKTGFT